MKDILVFGAVMAGWIVLNMWVLPYFGFRTCMSGGCRVPEVKRTAEQVPPAIHDSQPSVLAPSSRTQE